MPPNIAHYLSKTVLVAIPALFADGACRPFTLLGVELHGLWLQSDELTRRLLPDDKYDLAGMPAAIFVPFAQIAGVLVTAGSAPEQQQPKSVPPAAAVRSKSRARSAARNAGAATPKQ